MKTYLLPEQGNFYKVNMHSHSTLSDGRHTPEELKQMYTERGYHAIAYTEHGKLHDLSHLSDENFVAIRSYEIDFLNKEDTPFCFYKGPGRSFAHMEAVHMNLYALNDEAQQIDIAELRKKFTIENINEAVRRAKEAGFMVIYNHPHWSMNTYPLYTALEGVDGLELINGASNRGSDLDYTPHVYDEMSCTGHRLICVGGDDNHNMIHRFRAWTMVKAPALTADGLVAAMMAGDCYATEGPEIKELYIEDGKVTIRTSPAAGIYYSTATRARSCITMEENGGEPLTEATFTLDPEHFYFRISVKDATGKHANTRTYYADEWGLTEK